jgi:MSHA biogenesis protein MshP
MVLAALGAFVLVIGSTQHSTAMQAVQSARARQAAMAGLDWAYYQALRNGSCASTTPLAFGGALAGFQVTASCIPAGTYREDGRVVTAYRVSAIAHRGTPGRVDYVERQLQANLWR